MSRVVVGLLLALALPAGAQGLVITSTESPRSGAVELRLGSYRPAELGSAGSAFTSQQIFGNNHLLLAEVEIQRFVYQGVGSAGLGLSFGYAEKWGQVPDQTEKTAVMVAPLQLNALYKFDYAAFTWGVPLVPYGKLGLNLTPFWSQTGADAQGGGTRYGWGAAAGLMFMLDVVDRRFARDFDTDLGVNHSYLFAEYVYRNVNNFGNAPTDLSSTHWMFGLALDY